jgi:glycosyltransferase involved in cell wall biosynthesis
VNYLFIHQNFPAQFVHLSGSLAAGKRNKVVALSMRANPAPENVAVHQYSLLRSVAPQTHPMLQEGEMHVMFGEACAAAALGLKRAGFEPDVIVAHSGWGEALFIRDVFPKAKIVLYCEYYYAAEGQDVGFDPDEPPISFQQRCQLRMRNATSLLSLDIADAAICPTQWQKSTYPAWAQDKITVIHEGIDLDRLQFNPAAQLRIKRNQYHDELVFKPGDEVLSFVARNLEPTRGFDVFMRTLPDILRWRPKADVIIVGGDDISYGRPAPDGTSWRLKMLSEVGAELDMSRVHFTGQLDYATYLQLLSISRVHAYWTKPFVLSWSFLEAACSGIATVASATPPVLEFAESLAVKTMPYFDILGFAEAISVRLANPRAGSTGLRLPTLDISHCVSQQTQLLRA